MSLTPTQIDTLLAALWEAYGTGTLEVRVDGKMLRYADGPDMMRRIRSLEAERSKAAGTPRPVAGYAAFGRGGA